MQVSFIIPLYNCLALTQTAVRTLQASLPEGLAYEIILVDDGSTDGTREWLRTLPPSFRIILNERNLGYAGANNRGAAAASGRLLVLLNNDLEFEPGWIEPMLAGHEQRGERAGLTGNVQVLPDTGQIDHAGMEIDAKAKPRHRKDWDPITARLAPLRIVPAVTAACVLVTRETWMRLGGFDEGFRNGGEDVDLCFRASSRGLQNAVALASVVRHHVSSSPGRKARDEQNSRRLALRWRTELERAAAPAWARQYLTENWGRPPGLQPLDHAIEALRYGLSPRRPIPAFIQRGVRAAMEAEIERWRRLFPDVSDAQAIV